MSGTLYYADNYFFPQPEVSDSAGVIVRPFIFTPKTALVATDTVKLAPIKAMTGIVLLDWFLDLADQDSGGTPTWAFELGDNTTAGKFVATGNTKGQSAAYLSNYVDGVVASIPCTYTADNDFLLTVTASPQTGPTTTNVMKGWIKYVLAGIPSGI